MGQGNSRQLFVHMLKTMLKGRRIHVNKLQLEKFLLFIEEVCPWFPEEGTVSLETWKKVGKTTGPLRYDLNQIPYNYTVEVTNRSRD